MNTPTAEPPAIFQADFRAAAGSFPTGVTVVTRRSANRQPYGMTVSSFTSVSLTPPLILVCIDKRAGFGADLLPEPMQPLTFAVNILREDQQPLAVRFSTGSEHERFAGVPWEAGWNGVPLLGGTVASFSCTAENVVNAGDHFIVVGLVQEIRRGGGRPLVWCASAYHCLPAQTGPGLPAQTVPESLTKLVE